VDCARGSCAGFSTLLSRHVRLLLLLVWYVWIAVVVLVVFQRGARPVIPVADIDNSTVRGNGVGVFSIGRMNTETDHRPAFSISGSNLRANNAHHGIFNTPLSKTITIDDLKAALHFGTASEKPPGLEAGGLVRPDVVHAGLPSSSGAVDETGESTHGFNQLLFELRRDVLSALAGDEVKVSLPIDVSNVMGVVG